jgi:cell division protein FtsL
MYRSYIQSTPSRPQQPVRQKDPVQFRTLMLILFACSLIVLGVLSYIWRGVEIISMGYRMRDVYYQQKILQEQRQKLLLERAALRSLDRVERIATTELKLVKPNPDQVIVLSTRDAEKTR